MPVSDLRIPSAKRLELTSESIKVLVGKDETPFIVQKSTLCASSDFFAAALKPEWKEAKERTIRLPEQSVETFEIYLQWLNSGNIATQQDEKAKHYKEYLQLIHAYALGDTLQDTAFVDALTDCFIAKAVKTSVCPGLETIGSLYKHTPDKSPARKLMVDMYVWKASGNGLWFYAGKRELANKDFLYDCLEAMSAKRKAPTEVAPYLTTEVSQYHATKRSEKSEENVKANK
ncbi:hypothetical protein LTS18_005489 [Coniosporium uncinatum]|uniref:Uncharacterized protein n=1 Tax=Coniosporium uncinatum TaxID=93489 RepID=A0ACC3DR36_9PEZI|nr:hypothetical protein LTS18_005489 [Coniosporium uncinatum]